MKILNEYDIRNRIAKNLINAQIDFEIQIKIYADENLNYYKDAGKFIIKSKTNKHELDNINIRSNIEIFNEKTFEYNLERADDLVVWGFGFCEYDNITIDSLVNRLKPIINYGIRIEYENKREKGTTYTVMKEEKNIDNTKNKIERKYKIKINRITNFSGTIDKVYKN